MCLLINLISKNGRAKTSQKGFGKKDLFSSILIGALVMLNTGHGKVDLFYLLTFALV